ncbi:TetR/AcrR family transcriptional regulator [Streptomyces sp. ST2-7A]|uniref:TetR/AcrR family transcriptional regulator n=1 Tax=Streptomyces sp. ST2-7A TaxID=2907214 RepID=UPI001F45D57F|nr:TetR/AcrR family transcriptional regulator [Streptomyces sp. ST2-7A]MCE7079832.1 TetR/AcrR family transcriptional regulator [Streptomyces sp. ST2-7A]
MNPAVPPPVDPPAARPGAAGRVRRADAERNRRAIIEAADAVLAEQGGAVDVREIARRSGVGMGTLYRHFPTKDDLLHTVLEGQFASWAGAASRAAGTTGDPRRALREFFENALEDRARHRAVVEHCGTAWTGPAPDCVGLLTPVIDDLRGRALAAGVLRPDVTTEDLSLLLASLGQVVQMTAGTCPGMWRRHLRICLDGLDPAHTEPLPAAGSRPVSDPDGTGSVAGGGEVPRVDAPGPGVGAGG